MQIEPLKVVVNGKQLTPAQLPEYWTRERDAYKVQIGHVLSVCAAELLGALLCEKDPKAYAALDSDVPEPELKAAVDGLLGGLAARARQARE